MTRRSPPPVPSTNPAHTAWQVSLCWPVLFCCGFVPFCYIYLKTEFRAFNDLDITEMSHKCSFALWLLTVTSVGAGEVQRENASGKLAAHGGRVPPAAPGEQGTLGCVAQAVLRTSGTGTHLRYNGANRESGTDNGVAQDFYEWKDFDAAAVRSN